ncbi:hypothetical protein H0484_03140 [Pusillimonas sp. CC-YST705]|uniref:Uncharacterized protein n=1 Tax=Mesopusillimonas faecipullorum TaxID=2755040 RepID=A0ABS8C9N9_9BURK|nr:hypothetical protein [Mesopusillimonas faecipullorum]MCB5362750.1 hypothetical protein [Mesopusillimonas faecipullorum]
MISLDVHQFHPLLLLLNPLPIEADVLNGTFKGAFFLAVLPTALLAARLLSYPYSLFVSKV